MAEAQNAFETLVADKAAVEGGIDLPTVSENRPELVRRINLLLDTIGEWQIVAPTPELEAAIDERDEIIVRIAALALARRTAAQQETPPPAP